MELHGYQHRAVEMVMQEKSLFVMADVGLGKTAIALKAIEKAGLPTIVMAPLRVVYSTWPSEIKKWTPDLTYTILHGNHKNQRLKFDRDIYLLNYDGLKWFFNACSNKQFRLRKSFMVWDESSFIKNPSTLRFKLLKKLWALYSPYRLCLSATPAPNGLHELWSQMFLIDKGKRLTRSFYNFRNNYFHYTGPPIYKMYPRSDTEERIQTQIQGKTFRLSAADYLKLPETIYNKIEVTLPKKAKADYHKLEKTFFLRLEDGEVNVGNAAAMAMKLRQFVQGFVYDGVKEGTELHLEKIKALKTMIEGSSGNPILCPIQFKHELKMIKREIDPDVPIIAGGTSAAMSNTYIHRWNTGDLPLLLCHPASLGHGVNLQAGGHIVLWYAMTWSLEQYMQLNGRLARQGQKSAVIVNHLIVKDTIDEVIMGALKSKNATQKSLLEALNAYRKVRTCAP